ncbi:GIY-YIG nuclease family protein [Reyranella sp.]|uniref:GIY-YIG nuclease family protein n=1 Tax=Reyranella sp. TaxID=1929291 RepID=UPI003D11E823
MDRAYYVYVLTGVNPKVVYVGVTNSLENRVAEHRSGEGSAFTQRYRVHTLIHAEEYRYIEDAIAREKEIKGWRRSKKDALVEATNPAWADLLEIPVTLDPSLRSG